MHRDRLFIFCGENYILSFDIYYWWVWLKNIIFLTGLFHFLKDFSSFSHRTSEYLLCYYIHSYERRCNNVMLKKLLSLFCTKVVRNSEIMLCAATLQKWDVKAWWNSIVKCFKICHIFGIQCILLFLFFHLVQLYFFPNEWKCPVYHVTRAFTREKAVVVRIEKRKKTLYVFSYSKNLYQNLKGFSRSFHQA